MAVSYNPIGIIRTPFKQAAGMPIQPSGARGIKGSIDIKHEYVDRLKTWKDFPILFFYTGFTGQKDMTFR